MGDKVDEDNIGELALAIMGRPRGSLQRWRVVAEPSGGQAGLQERMDARTGVTKIRPFYTREQVGPPRLTRLTARLPRAWWPRNVLRTARLCAPPPRRGAGSQDLRASWAWRLGARTHPPPPPVVCPG